MTLILCEEGVHYNSISHPQPISFLKPLYLVAGAIWFIKVQKWKINQWILYPPQSSHDKHHCIFNQQKWTFIPKLQLI